MNAIKPIIAAFFIILGSTQGAYAGLVHDFTIVSDDLTTVNLTGVLEFNQEISGDFSFAISNNTAISSFAFTGGSAFGIESDLFPLFANAGFFQGNVDPSTWQLTLVSPSNFGWIGASRDLGVNPFTTTYVDHLDQRPPQSVLTQLTFTHRASVPEPGTLALFVFGLVGFVGWSRRKRT